MQLATNHPDAILARASNLIGRVLDLTPLAAGQEALDRLSDILPGIPLVSRAENIRASLTRAVEFTIKRGLSPFTPEDDQGVAQRTVEKLEEFLGALRRGSIFGGGLGIDEARVLMGRNFLGPEAYDQTLGARVDSASPLPSGLTRRLLNSSCPLSPGTQMAVRDTHLLVYLPSDLYGHPLTVNNLARLVGRMTRDGDFPTVAQWSTWHAHELFADATTAEGRWALIPKNILPGSRQKGLESQEKLLSRYSGYGIADARELTIALALYSIASNERIYTHFGRCQNETFDKQRVCVGFSSDFGFVIDRSPPDYARPHIGLAVSRRLYLER